MNFSHIRNPWLTIDVPPNAFSDYLLGTETFFSLSRVRERVGVRACQDSGSTPRSSLTLALSQRERELLSPQEIS
jgi:hypothetical protein